MLVIFDSLYCCQQIYKTQFISHSFNKFWPLQHVTLGSKLIRYNSLRHCLKSGQQRGKKKAKDSRLVPIEEHRCPAFYEARVPGKPQDHQQDKDREHCCLSKRHAPQLIELILHHFVCLPISVGFHAAAKWLLQAVEECTKGKDTSDRRTNQGNVWRFHKPFIRLRMKEIIYSPLTDRLYQ